MQYYFVDYENVHMDGFVGMKPLQSGDCVVIMYSENSKNITIDVMRELLTNGASIQCFKASVGSKNALDFQLSSYLGYMIGRQPSQDAKYFIVSKDTGYDKLCEFWSQQGVDVKRVGNLSGTAEPPVPTPQPEKPRQQRRQTRVPDAKKATIEEIEKCLAPEDSPAEILEIVNQYKTKQSIMRGISQKIKDSKKAGAVYQKLKPLLKEKGKT